MKATGDVVLLTDLDNTLFNWIDYFGPCVRAMVHALAHATKLEENEIYRQFKQVYSRFETPEYRQAIQELDLCQSQPSAEQQRLVRAGFVAFSRTRKLHLQAYKNVPSTLKWLKRQNVTIIGVTNSWVVDAVGRLRFLGLTKYLDGLVAWDGVVHDRGQPKIGLASDQGHAVVPIPSQSRKPNADAYRAAIAHCGSRPDASLWVIGDSVTNDLLPAREIGATTVWAKYGRKYEQENFDTVVQVTPWAPERIVATYDTTMMTPDFVIDDFAELRSIMPAIEGELFQVNK
jgi:FMN phosphatase YigB (HAD superfamily)